MTKAVAPAWFVARDLERKAVGFVLEVSLRRQRDRVGHPATPP
jgi:hypothetical protein